jgi:hypothetical protein
MATRTPRKTRASVHPNLVDCGGDADLDVDQPGKYSQNSGKK